MIHTDIQRCICIFVFFELLICSAREKYAARWQIKSKNTGTARPSHLPRYCGTVLFLLNRGTTAITRYPSNRGDAKPDYGTRTCDTYCQIVCNIKQSNIHLHTHSRGFYLACSIGLSRTKQHFFSQLTQLQFQIKLCGNIWAWYKKTCHQQSISPEK